MNKHYDVIVIGAGPAGISASTLCDSNGASTLLLDESLSPGGQIYRSIEEPVIDNKMILGSDYYKGKTLSQCLRDSSVDYVPGATIWQVSDDASPNIEVSFHVNGDAHTVSAERLIVTTGAQERPFVVSGWTLSGVMNAGAAQILLKSSGLAAREAVFIGSGPLLYLIVRQYLLAGVPVKAILDTTPVSNYIKTTRYALNSFYGLGQLMKGLQWIKEIKRSGIPFIRRVTDVQLVGDKSVQCVKYKTLGGKWDSVKTEHVFLHQGVVPNINLTMAIGCKHQWQETGLYWKVLKNNWFETTVARISVAGDGGGIGGAIAAENSGAIAALGVLCKLGYIQENERDSLAISYRKILEKESKFRQFLDSLFMPATIFRVPREESTIVCRCESVTAQKINDAIRVGCTNPNQLKTFTRCGMGPCQGRFCSLTVSEMISKIQRMPVQNVGHYRIRYPIKPISIGLLSQASKQLVDAEKRPCIKEVKN